LIDEIEPSFFEITVAMAFEYFVLQKVDIAIIEVGLGGRFDSTNIITPELSVITNIGWDHMNILGDTLEKIAFEKAGIIKQHIPVVIGEISTESRPVFEAKAASVEAPVIFAQEKIYIAEWNYEHHQLVLKVGHHSSDERQIYHLDLPGLYQTKNLLTVLETVHQLSLMGWKIDNSIIQKALMHVKKLTGLHGRWEVVHQNPFVILDVGHNIDGIKQITEQLEIATYDHLHIVIGMVKDKEVEKVLALLPHHASYYFTNAHIPRAMDAETLKMKAADFLLKGNSYTDVNIALQAAMVKATKKDVILVCGSVFLVGEVTI
jgi:dihydrofolate synthase/folylpolyglutamate synthase